MGKYIIEYLIPVFILVPLAWYLIKRWYLKSFPKTVDTIVEIDKASDKYDKKLNK